MDLTKIVLPTFILERRSLLEMYADFFAHPDIFVNITEKSTPEERMVQVCFYMPTFQVTCNTNNIIMAKERLLTPSDHYAMGIFKKVWFSSTNKEF